jgi:hypothetical protein
LAAYNGGWDQIHLRVTRRYAADVLDHYARAVAVEHGLLADGDWTAIISVEGVPVHKTVTVLGPDRPLTRYTERPLVQDDVPSVPEGSPPHATLITFADERGQEAHVSLWLVSHDHSSLGTFAVFPASAGSVDSETSANGVVSQGLDRWPE